MRVMLIIDVDADIHMSPDTVAQTLGTWVECLPSECRTIETETDHGAPATIRVIRADAAAPVIVTP